MAKYIALQPILYNGRMHKPGEVIDCQDMVLATRWIANRAATTGEPEAAPEPAAVSVAPEPEPASESTGPKLGRRAKKNE